MRTLSQLTIKNKIIAITLFTSILVLLLSTTAFVVNGLISFRNTLADELTTLAELSSRNAAASVLFYDYKTAREDLQSLGADPHITHALIITTEKRVFAQYAREDAATGDRTISYSAAPPLISLSKPLTPGHKFYDSYIDVVSKIIFDGEHIGYIVIRSDLDEWNQRITQYSIIVLSVLLLSMVLAYALASCLQRIVSKPIHQLADLTKEVTLHQNYTLRAIKHSHDELGDLTDGFNEMLTEIGKRDQALSTYQSKLEGLVEKRTEQLAKARDQALAANHAKSLFLANMSHEIRTPMNAVLGYAQVLSGSQLNPEQRKSIDIISRSGQHLLELINDILDISKIEAGAMELKEEPFDLTELITTLSEMFRLRCVQKDLSWQIHYPFLDAQPVYGDQGKLRQVLINLLGNAVKFTDSGSVQLSVTYEEGDKYLFVIKDSGCGIPKERQASIFQLFHQESEGHKKGGTGLGLSIAKRQVELMGGELTLASGHTEGACFRFAIKLPVTGEEMTTPVTYPARNIESFRCQGSALVVDDVQENRELLAIILENMGFEITLADDGVSALKQLQKSVPDLVMMDIRMPEMDGNEALKNIRQIYGNDHPKCIAVTASSFEHNREAFLKAGFDDFISKPFNISSIHSVLSRFVHFEKEPFSETPPSLTQQAAGQSHAPLPGNLYRDIKEAAELGKLSDIQQYLNQLRESDDTGIRQTADSFQVLLDNIDIDGILNLLEEAGHAE